MPEEGGASQPDAETTTAPVENSAPPQHMAQEPINQLISVVGWALADTHPDGFHSKYLETGDMAALTEAALTLASQGPVSYTHLADVQPLPVYIIYPIKSFSINSIITNAGFYVNIIIKYLMIKI